MYKRITLIGITVLKTKWTRKQILLYVGVKMGGKNESFKAGGRQLGKVLWP